MNNIILPKLVQYLDDKRTISDDVIRLNKFVDYVVKTIYLEYNTSSLLYHSPHKTDLCVKVFEATIMTDIECSLPSHCGEMYIRDEKLTWFENKKLCVGTGVCKRQGQLGCSNGFRMLSVKYAQESSPNFIYDSNIVGRVDVTTVGKFVVFYDVYTNLYYVVSRMCTSYLYTTRESIVELPNMTHSSSNVDEYCLYDVSSLCRFIGPFRDEYTAIRSLPISVDIVMEFQHEPTAIIGHVFYDSFHLLQLSRYGPTAVVGGIPNMEVVCYKTEYIQFSVAVIFEKQLNHLFFLIAGCSQDVENYVIRLYERMLDYVKHYIHIGYSHVRYELFVVYDGLKKEIMVGVKYISHCVKSFLQTLTGPVMLVMLTSPYIESFISFMLMIVYGYSVIRSLSFTMVLLIVVLFCFNYD